MGRDKSSVRKVVQNDHHLSMPDLSDFEVSPSPVPAIFQTAFILASREQIQRPRELVHLPGGSLGFHTVSPDARNSYFQMVATILVRPPWFEILRPP